MNYWINYIHTRVTKYNKNAIILCTGKTGSGKSYLCMRMCQELDKDFNINRIVFDAHSFMELITSGNLKRGSCILWDEGGSLGSREYMSLVNRSISLFLQSFRALNLIVFIAIPSREMIDINVRRLMHVSIVTDGIDYQKNVCKAKFFNVDYPDRSKRVYYKYQRLYRRDRVRTLTRVNIGLPSKTLRTDYEIKKSAFLRALSKDVLRKVAPLVKTTKKLMTNEETLKIVDKKLVKKDKKVTIDNVMAVTGLSNPKARKIRALYKLSERVKPSTN